MTRSAPPLSLGFLGSGFITRFHLQALAAVRDCTVGGIFSPRTAHAEEAAALAKKLGLGAPRVFSSPEELAADPGVDAVWVCAPNFTRIELQEALAAGNARRKAPLRGVACEKPLARTLKEAVRVAEIAAGMEVPTGYLEDMLFVPHLVRAKEILWARAVGAAGLPYLARGAEEHGGPHEAWFWRGEKSGGGALLDMMCHSLEAARWLLTPPGAPRSVMIPVSVTATTATLKWSRPDGVAELRRRYGGVVDYARRPSEDYARATVRWRREDGQEAITESTTSWCFVGSGIRHTFELLGPEYSFKADLSKTGAEVFLSRALSASPGEDMVEKQNAEQGLLPFVPEETATYGYVGEDRHFVRAFREGTPPGLTYADGVEVVRLMMACYKAAETGKAVDPDDPDLVDYVPVPARPA